MGSLYICRKPGSSFNRPEFLEMTGHTPVEWVRAHLPREHLPVATQARRNIVKVFHASLGSGKHHLHVGWIQHVDRFFHACEIDITI